MGLDQYLYRAKKAGARDEFYENATFANGEVTSPTHAEPTKLAYWRKHGNLHGWMCERWLNSSACPADASADDFNGVEVELTWQDVDDLEKAVKARELPETSGFFFGNGNTEHYRDYDLEACASAKADLFLGLRVFYNSSW